MESREFAGSRASLSHVLHAIREADNTFEDLDQETAVEVCRAILRQLIADLTVYSAQNPVPVFLAPAAE